MSIPYRTQQTLKRLAVTLLILLVVAAIVWALWILWLQRFVVYTRDAGAIIDFEVPQTLAVGQEALPPEEDTQIEIHYNEGEGMVSISKELTQLKGYYLMPADLSADTEALWQQIQTLPTSTAIMMDVKNIYGEFFYATGTGRPISEDVSASAVEDLIGKLKNKGYYLIARVPALRDRAYGLENVMSGLPTKEGYLWMDGDGCYWLNPTKEDTVSYLINIAQELRDMGFNEVVFEEFRFPDTQQIVFKADKAQTLADTAQLLVTGCATDSFAVSFVTDGTWTAPTGRTRVYRNDVTNPAELSLAVEESAVADPVIGLVFITNNVDVRFDAYSVLRPINLAH